jgi:hypothetical protein
MRSAAFERIIRDARDVADPCGDPWSVIRLLSRAEKLKGDERRLAVVAVVRAMLRKRALLDLAEAVLADLPEETGGFMEFDARAELARLRGDSARSKELRRRANAAADAPTANEKATLAWVKRELAARQADPSSHRKRKRLDEHLKQSARRFPRR